MADKSKFTPVAIIQWPGFFKSRNISLDKAKEVYGPTEEHNMRGDAYRHLVWQALMSKKFGPDFARLVGEYHESRMPAMLGGAGIFPDEQEKEMDLYNNALGLEIAKQAKTPEDVYKLAKEYVDSGKAKYMTLPEVIRKSREEEGDQSAY